MSKPYTTSDLEILVATMDRDSLDFLEAMFAEEKLRDHPILIINQTSEGNLLHSPHHNIRVINTFKKGISKSRNLALKNAEGSLCLLTDDDVVFVEGFAGKIVTAFNTVQDADLITFQTETFEGNPYWNYPEEMKKLGRKEVLMTLSVEICIKRESFFEKGVYFNELFGLGATYEDSENFIFLKEFRKTSGAAYFYPATIVRHQAYSSSDAVASDRVVFARGARYFYEMGLIGHVFLLNYIFFLYRKKFIIGKEIMPKLRIGLRGIRTFKSLNKQNS